MRALTVAELLNVWERGLRQTPVGRALAMLGAACPDSSPEELASLTIGQRDSQLLTLREWTFGSAVTSLAVCAHCRQTLELTFSVSDVRAESASAPGESSLQVSGYEVTFRPPNSADLEALAGCGADSASRRLFERCLIAARREGAPAQPERLPAEVIEAVAERLAEADPQADVRLDLHCPHCEGRWSAAFDIVSFFWTEIEAWARRLLREVHILARAYGWPERDILAMSAQRRHMYIQMAAE